jgi:hypothetical protein
VSCAINSILCHKDKLKFNEAGTIVTKIEDGGVIRDASSGGGAAGEEDGGTPAPQGEPEPT